MGLRFIQAKGSNIETPKGEKILFVRRVLAVLLLFMLNVATAETVDVNQTSILVSDTVSNDSLKLKQAFAQIIAKSTGENIIDVLSDPVFGSANIKKGVKRSYFEKIEAKYFQSKQNKFWFHLVMDDKFVQKIIQQAGFSLLPHNREKIMLWIVKEPTGVDSQSTALIVQEEVEEPSLSYAYDDELTMYWINRWAKALGIVLVMPKADEQDRLVVTPNLIKSLSYEAIDQSYNRYDAQQSLLIYIKNSTQNIKIRTGLTLSGIDMSIKHFQEQADTDQVIEEGELLYSVMQEVAQKYANLYKINQQDLENHTVRILIHSIDDYQQVNYLRKYLTGLSVIDNYDIVSASRGELILNVNMSINSEAFLRLIQREGVLVYDNKSPLNQMFFSLTKSSE